MGKNSMPRNIAREVSINPHVNFVPKKRQQRSLRFTQDRKKGVQKKMTSVEGMNVLEVVSRDRRYRQPFYELRRSLNGKKPFAIVARTLQGKNSRSKPRYTIWVKDIRTLEILRDELNKKEHRGKRRREEIAECHYGEGYDWGFDLDKNGKLLIKSPNKDSRTILSYRVIKKIIYKVLRKKARGGVVVHSLPYLVKN